MNASINRICAVALKEWRLNLRFVLEFLFGQIVTPLKSAVILIFLYSGIFTTTNSFLGALNKENYIPYVLLGSILHSQFNSASGILSGKLVCEKYWQTSLGTLLSPASIYEVACGFAIGSGALSVLVNIFMLLIFTVLFHASWTAFSVGIISILLMAVLGLSIGLIGATVGLVWEGKFYIYNYAIQAITILSCLYYPIEIMPESIQPFIRQMPTYQLGQVLHHFYTGASAVSLPFVLAYMIATAGIIFLCGGTFYNHAVRRFGVVGY